MARQKIHNEPFIQLTRPQYLVLKKDLEKAKKAGKLPKSWQPLFDEIETTQRVRGQYVTLGKQLMTILKKFQKELIAKATGDKVTEADNHAYLMYERMIAKAVAKAEALGLTL